MRSDALCTRNTELCRAAESKGTSGLYAHVWLKGTGLLHVSVSAHACKEEIKETGWNCGYDSIAIGGFILKKKRVPLLLTTTRQA